jgi:DNA-binding NtrC family response regulator
MQQAQVITYGIDAALAEKLRQLAHEKRFRLRETGQLSACRSLVQATPPSVLVLELGRDLEAELALLEQVHALVPAMASIVVGDTDNPVLAGLAWELGATFVLFPPTPVEWIGELLARMLEASP